MNNEDLSDFLKAWPYNFEDNIRVITCSDGRKVMQVRQPMGVEQYELDGRPDGLRPHGMESALHYYEAQLAEARANNMPFFLNHEQCDELREEGVIYYFRYLHCFAIRDWERTVRDTARNIRVFDLLREYAEDEEDRVALEQWRPYILRMNAVARAMIAVENDRHDKALGILRNVEEAIENLPNMDNQTFRFERQRSLKTIRALKAQVEANRPRSEIEALEERLREAVLEERFEQAAALRDRIRELRAAKGEQANNA